MVTGFRSPRKIIRRLKLMPAAAKVLRDWPRFMFNYALGLVPRRPYSFRSGARLQIGRGVDHVPIIEIFIRADYGQIPDRAIIVDLGANIGTFTVFAAAARRDVTVYAYEPMPEFFDLLQQNVRINKLEQRVKCFNVAVAAAPIARGLVIAPEGRFFPALADPADRDASGLSVQCTTLTAIVAAHDLEWIDLLKIDCEGAEYEILFSTPRETLRRIAEIRLEYHKRAGGKDDPARLRHFLEANQFAIYHDKQTSSFEGNLWGRRRETG